MPATCSVCQSPAPNRCSRCKSVSYCSEDCQHKDWKSHKAVCNASPKPTLKAPSSLHSDHPGFFSPDSWARDLSPAEAAEWFVDCYRMRVDDDMLYRATMRGLYDDNATPRSIVSDFLIFCKLAVLNKVVPPNFSWSLCLTKARRLLPYAFEKSDAQEKYGGENVFAAATGGRSLRATGEGVYGTGIMGGTGVMGYNGKDEYCRFEEAVGDGKQIFEKPEFFEDVGGVTLWKELFANYGR